MASAPTRARVGRRRPAARLRFYAELNDYLLPGRRQAEFPVPFEEGASLGALVASCGVPLSEVDLLLADGEPASPLRPARNGERIAVFPVFESFDISRVTLVRGEALRQTRFAVDRGLERLAALLEARGLDVARPSGRPRGPRAAFESELQRLSREETRIVLTRDEGLPARLGLSRACVLRASGPARQAAEVLERFHLVQ